MWLEIFGYRLFDIKADVLFNCLMVLSILMFLVMASRWLFEAITQHIEVMRRARDNHDRKIESILHRLSHRTIIMKDAGSILDLPPEDQQKLFGALRDVYDHSASATETDRQSGVYSVPRFVFAFVSCSPLDVETGDNDDNEPTDWTDDEDGERSPEVTSGTFDDGTDNGRVLPGFPAEELPDNPTVQSGDVGSN